MKMITKDLSRVIAAKSLPGITIWNRLEGRPRADQFERALRAEVRDPLWMITRQWQMGEFRGDDAGSPITARVRVETTELQRYQAAAGSPEALDPNIPLEAKVERLPLSFEQRGIAVALDLRLMLGRHWNKLIRALPAAARDQYLINYPIVAPDPSLRESAPICAHPDAWSTFAAVAGRKMDGYRLYAYLKADPSHRASDGIAALVGFEAEADALGERFVAWFERLIDAPQTPSAWLPERLEYQFSCSAPTDGEGAEKVYTAEQYHHGHLDWYNFDVDPERRDIVSRRGSRRSELGSDGANPIDVANAGEVQRDAEYSILGVRRQSNELRRHQTGHDRSRQASPHGVRLGLCERLVSSSVHHFARHRRYREGYARYQRFRRAHLGRCCGARGR
ncbi:MAG: hypothetical protein QM784_01165 [Polyangiaceae bacterium]